MTPRYDFATYSRVPQPRFLCPRPVIFVDGLWLLRSAELRPLFDLKIFLDTPAALRHERRLIRDTLERGYSAGEVRERLRGKVLPMHDRYVEPQKRWADLVLAQPYHEAQVEQLANRLWTLLTRANVLPCWMHETFRAELLSLLVQHEYAS